MAVWNLVKTKTRAVLTWFCAGLKSVHVCGIFVVKKSHTFIMPQTRVKGGPRVSNKPPLEQYEALEPYKQLICYNYWVYLDTKGQKGWNPKASGSVLHQRSSAWLIKLGSASWFRHIAKSMVVLAEKLAEQSEKIRCPRVPFPEIELPQLNPVTNACCCQRNL